MTNLRIKAIAILAAVAVVSGSALATSSAAQAGSKTDLAKALVGGLVVGAIAGAVASSQPGPVVVHQPRGHRFGGTRHGFRGQRDGFRGHRNGFRGHQQAGFDNGGCFTKEVVTIDRWGNRASSLQTICR